MNVLAYRNLNAGRQSPRWSIKVNGLVVATATDVHLANCTFTVSTAGLARVRRTRERWVMAWVEGDLLACSNLQPAGRHPERTVAEYELLSALPAVTPITGARVRFNPFEDDTFHDSGTPVHYAVTCYLASTGACLVRSW